MIKILKPIYVRESYIEPVARDLLSRIYDVIFLPIFDVLGFKRPKRINSISDVFNALRSGKIFWQEGYFYGQFNAAVARTLRGLGATFSSQKKGYKLDITDIPIELRAAIAIGKGVNKLKTERILKSLEESEKTKVILGTGDKAVATLDSLNQQAIKTFKVLPESIQIPYELTEQQKKNLLKNYTENLELYINDWKQQQIERLRIKTQQNAALGYRSDKLAKIVKSEFGVSESKAKFLARQETSIFVSKYREERYTNAGIKEYIWSTSLDERVRDSHKELHRKKFSWDSPPIVDKNTGRRANPGEDFQCRCLALPVLRLGVS